ncbi:MAG: ABC transporter permease [Alphaproteobacteria bacterium]|jgi:ABC-2 type transport system permease protein|nr:ABC transporter permease [Alphaproteobacteria bacterium]MBP7729219.1 ABC transporter permease [Alphaproteobacteria bacterium]
MNQFSFQRFLAYLQKEGKQILRDPSTILIAFVLPLIMIFIFGYGVSLDADKVPLGILLEDISPTARSLENAFFGTHYFNVTTSYNRLALEDALTGGHLRGIVTIPQNFSQNLLRGTVVPLQVLLDGSEPNTARFVLNYAQGVVNNWSLQQAIEGNPSTNLPIIAEPRVWFNEDLKSRYVLLPGSIAIIMSLIGTLLTALVVAREWERGTMEAMMATPLRIQEMLLAKLVPYFLLGLGSMVLCVTLSITLFSVPFRGSYFILLLSTSVFLLAALGLGLLISSTTRNQLVASQISIMTGFLPAFILSGFIFEISSMPWSIQAITYLFPPRYFVSILQSCFLSGTTWEIVVPDILMMLLIACFFLGISALKSVKRLD